MTLPKAILLDLDDTILDDSGHVQACWADACHAGAPECGVAPEVLLRAIEQSSEWYWSDPERHRIGRLDLPMGRAEVVRLALAELAVPDDMILARRISGIYADLRDERMEPLPDAIDTLRWFRQQGCKLALLTNGNAVSQRKKITQFGLEGFFDAIFIEGEVGFGKPDPRVFRLALDTLGVDAKDAWMVGDNLEWDVAQPQQLGIFAIWIDAAGKGHRKLASIRPDRVIRALAELRSG